MPLPMSPLDSVFLHVESRERPMHVGSLELFVPPDGADALDVRRMYEDTMNDTDIAALFRKRAHRSLASLGQWSWEVDRAFDLEHHVRRSALPQPGRVLELLALCSRLHSTLLDRHRPLWEMHLVEGLADGRFAIYTKTHHAMVDGVSGLRLLARMLSPDAAERDMPPPWAPPRNDGAGRSRHRPPTGPGALAHEALSAFGEVAGMVPALARTVNAAFTEHAGSLSVTAPKSMLNVEIAGARRFAAQSWPMARLRSAGKAADATVNDVVLAMCSGALRQYLLDLHALPDTPLVAMVPVSLHDAETGDAGGGGSTGDGGGNAVGAVMCNLGTHLDDPAARLATVHTSMVEGKELLRTMSPMQIVAMSGIGMSPLVLWPLLRLTGTVRPPFNLIISNVPGPARPMYWNGARLDGLYPLSIPLDGQALNITCTSYSDMISFGLTGCRRSVPHLQRLLTHLDAELDALSGLG